MVNLKQLPLAGKLTADAPGSFKTTLNYGTRKFCCNQPAEAFQI